MFNFCTACGTSHVEPEFDESGLVVCPSCGDRKAFRRLPLLLVGGPAGASKSATTRPPVTLLDTTPDGLAETGAKVAAWIRTHSSAD
jgi:uncharacterized Zn finger protein (UPF0148 family)